MEGVSEVSMSTSDIDQVQDVENGIVLKSGDRATLSALYNKYVCELYRYGFFLVPDKNLVEDAIHDLFVKLWSCKDGQLTIKSVKPYLFSSLRREVLARKKETVHVTHELDHLEESSYCQNSVEDSLIRKEDESFFKKRIQACINKLTDRQREIVYLRFYQNLPYLEISNLMGIDQDYAYNLISKAFSKLRKAYK